MPPYTTTHYTLDHSLILATVSKLYLLTDLRLWPRLLASEVFAPQFTLDYTSMFGGEPDTECTPAKAVEMFRGFMERMSATQHVLAGQVVEGLVVPISSAGVDGDGDKVGAEGKGEWPSKVRVRAYVTVHLVQKGAVGGEHTSNGGILEVECVRLGEVECERLYGRRGDGEGMWDGNPWRVSLFRPEVRWYEGNYGGILGVKLDD